MCLALNCSVPPSIVLVLPRPGLHGDPPDELSMAQKVLVWSDSYQGPALRSFGMGAGLGLVQVGLGSKGEGRGKTRDQLQKGELVER